MPPTPSSEGLPSTGTAGTLSGFIDALAEGDERTAILVPGPEGEGREAISAAALGNRVAREAAGLVARGLRRGESLAFFARGGIDWIAACLAAIRAGVVPVPLDLQLEADELERILTDCQARWILADRRSLARLERIDHGCRILLLGDPESDRESDREPSEPPEASEQDEPPTRHEHLRSWSREPAGRLPDPGPDDRGLLFYTSGTTGPPKGVPLAHRHLAYQLESLVEAGLVRPDDRVLLALPPHHVYPLVIGILGPLALGIPIVLPRSSTGPQMLRALDEGDATAMIAVPRIYAALLQGMEQRIASRGRLASLLLRATLRSCSALKRRLGWDPGRRILRPLRARVGPKLRMLVSGGSALSPELAWTLEGLGWQVAVGYGLTETAPLLTINPPGSRRLESVGRPVPGTEIRIEPVESDDTRDGRESEGEILARGPGVFDGYLNLEQETRESFTEDGWLRTGDLGWLDAEGFLHVSGRKSTLIVAASGEKIRTEEVEKAYAAHESIEEIGILWPEEEASLVAIVVPARDALEGDGGDPEDAIRRAVDERSRTLPSHQRLGRFVLGRSPLERTRLGKIRRHRLRERYHELQRGESAPSRRSPLPIRDMSAADQQRLAEPAAKSTWDLLCRRFPEDGLTPDSHLQRDLGIDSLGWLDLGLETAERTGVELSEDRLQSLETVRELLQAIGEASPKAQGRMKTPLESPEAELDETEQRWLLPLRPASASLARLLSLLNRLLMRLVFGLEVSGAERVPTKGPVILAPNHTSYLDPFVIAAGLPETIRERTFWGGWTGVAFTNRLLRAASRLARVFPVDPDRAVRSSLAFAAITLERDGHLVWFPEGQRSRTGELGELRPGIGRLLASHPDVPVVPIRIEGTFAAWPVHRRLPRPARVRIAFGTVLEPSALAEAGHGEALDERIVDGLARSLRRREMTKEE